MELEEMETLMQNSITRKQFEEIKNSSSVKKIIDCGYACGLDPGYLYLVLFDDNTEQTIFVQ